MIEIYLDMNIMVDCLQGRDEAVHNKIRQIKFGGAILPYSPAHMEEVAVIFREEKDEEKAEQYVENNLRFISEVTGNWEYLPNNDSGVVLKQEHPEVCFNRIVNQYEWAIFAEENERFLQCFRDEESFREYFNLDGRYTCLSEGMPLFAAIQKNHGIEKKQLGNVPPEEVFLQKNVLKALEGKMKNYCHSLNTVPKYGEMKSSHRTLESTIGLMLNFLEEVGYRTEARGRYRSRMHDVSHAIYATRSNYCVVGDRRFREKLQAVYGFLEVPSIVLSKEEFVGLDI